MKFETLLMLSRMFILLAGFLWKFTFEMYFDEDYITNC